MARHEGLGPYAAAVPLSFSPRRESALYGGARPRPRPATPRIVSFSRSLLASIGAVPHLMDPPRTIALRPSSSPCRNLLAVALCRRGA